MTISRLNEDTVGIFEAIDSFVVKTQMKYCVIGRFKEGNASIGHFLNIALNQSMSISYQITQIDEIEFASSRENYVLISCENQDLAILDILLSMNVGMETMEITISGSEL